MENSLLTPTRKLGETIRKAQVKIYNQARELFEFKSLDSIDIFSEIVILHMGVFGWDEKITKQSLYKAIEYTYRPEMKEKYLHLLNHTLTTPKEN